MRDIDGNDISDGCCKNARDDDGARTAGGMSDDEERPPLAAPPPLAFAPDAPVVTSPSCGLGTGVRVLAVGVVNEDVGPVRLSVTSSGGARGGGDDMSESPLVAGLSSSRG